MSSVPITPSATTPTAAPERASSGRAVEMPTDADAVRALAWLKRGKPETDIVYDDSTPKQSEHELSQFRRASYRRKKP